MRGAAAPSAPSEEGAGAPKGFIGATEGEITHACVGAVGIGVHKCSLKPLPHNIPLSFRQQVEVYPFSFVTEKKSGKTVKEKFFPLPSRSRVRLPPEGGINAPPQFSTF